MLSKLSVLFFLYSNAVFAAGLAGYDTVVPLPEIKLVENGRVMPGLEVSAENAAKLESFDLIFIREMTIDSQSLQRNSDTQKVAVNFAVNVRWIKDKVRQGTMHAMGILELDEASVNALFGAVTDSQKIEMLARRFLFIHATDVNDRTLQWLNNFVAPALDKELMQSPQILAPLVLH